MYVVCADTHIHTHARMHGRWMCVPRKTADAEYAVVYGVFSAAGIAAACVYVSVCVSLFVFVRLGFHFSPEECALCCMLCLHTHPANAKQRQDYKKLNRRAIVLYCFGFDAHVFLVVARK